MLDRKYNRMLIVVLSIWFAITIISSYCILGINLTDSLDTKAFIIKKGDIPIARGEYIAFEAPNNGIHNNTFVKIVGGVEGDVVKEESRKFYINDSYIGRAKEYSKKGDKAELGFTGVIPKGCFFVYSKHKDSYDSKYKNIGLVCVPNIIGSAYPIF